MSSEPRPEGNEDGEAKTTPEARAGREAEETRAGGVWEQVRTLVVAGLIALAIRAFVVEPFRIPSGSMLPTLLIGDHLFVNKFVYGIKIPFTDLRLPGLREPERGEVAVFTVARRGSQQIYPADRRRDLSREEFVKRIVGLPGDTIQVQDGVVIVNGERVQARDTGETFRDEAGRELRILRERSGERLHGILDDPNNRGLELRSFAVEPGRYFVMGDNRDHSNDSRNWGTVRKNELKGPAFILYWSWEFNGGWLPLLNPLTWWKTPKRWDRIFQPVE